MANIIACDRCGKQSPDAKGLHIGNGWWHVWNRHWLGVGRLSDDDPLLICDDCLRPVMGKAVNRRSAWEKP